MFYLYVDLCVLADVDIVASAINASTAIRLLYSPGSLLQAPPLEGKHPPVVFQLFQDLFFDFDSRVPEPSQLEESTVLIPKALL